MKLAPSIGLIQSHSKRTPARPIHYIHSRLHDVEPACADCYGIQQGQRQAACATYRSVGAASATPRTRSILLPSAPAAATTLNSSCSGWSVESDPCSETTRQECRTECYSSYTEARCLNVVGTGVQKKRLIPLTRISVGLMFVASDFIL